MERLENQIIDLAQHGLPFDKSRAVLEINASARSWTLRSEAWVMAEGVFTPDKGRHVKARIDCDPGVSYVVAFGAAEAIDGPNEGIPYMQLLIMNTESDYPVVITAVWMGPEQKAAVVRQTLVEAKALDGTRMIGAATGGEFSGVPAFRELTLSEPLDPGLTVETFVAPAGVNASA